MDGGGVSGTDLGTAATTKIKTSDPNPVAGFVPFNVKHVALTDPFTNRVVRYVAVAYAKRDGTTDDELAGAGLGYVNVFKPDGTFVKRLVNYNPDPAHPNLLNAPWGMATAHGKFGEHARYLLVGNFGDGTIHRFSLRDLSGHPLGALKNGESHDLVFDGLWGLHFGCRPNAPGHDDDDQDDVNENSVALYFAAGIGDEEHGLFGRIIAR